MARFVVLRSFMMLPLPKPIARPSTAPRPRRMKFRPRFFMPISASSTSLSSRTRRICWGPAAGAMLDGANGSFDGGGAADGCFGANGESTGTGLLIFGAATPDGATMAPLDGGTTPPEGGAIAPFASGGMTAPGVLGAMVRPSRAFKFLILRGFLGASAMCLFLCRGGN